MSASPLRSDSRSRRRAGDTKLDEARRYQRDHDTGHGDRAERSWSEQEPPRKRHRAEDGQERESRHSGVSNGAGDSGHSSRRHHHRHRHHHHRDDENHDRHHHHSAKRGSTERKELPFEARQLSRSDLAAFRPLFAHYLDLQKQLDLTALDETELRGRWKSFTGKWNRGELAEGWYDPEVFQRAVRDYAYVGDGPSADAGQGGRRSSRCRSRSPAGSDDHDGHHDGHIDEEEEDENDYGPPPPPSSTTTTIPPHRQTSSPNTTNHNRPAPAPGPAIPTQTDLALRDEAAADSANSALATHRLLRRAHRKEAASLLDELAGPRADAGTRERRLEKRAALNEKLRAFRDKSPGGGMDEGGGGVVEGEKDAAEEYREMVRAREARRGEKVRRREEVERARRAEREERVRAARVREEGVMEGLRALARERFGVPGEGGG